MKCPVDGATLVMAERSGVEIDYCPQCRGVWLDRGELDKIVDRAVPGAAAGPRDARGAGGPSLGAIAQELGSRLRDDRRGSGTHDDDEYKRRKKKSLLGDIFDF